MAELVEVKRLLGKDGERVQGLFVTIDPQRDTPEMLKAYMANFDPTFLALYATPEKLAQVAKDFKVYYKKSGGHDAQQLHHGPLGRLLCVRPARQIALVHPVRQRCPALAADIKLLLAQ